MQDMSGGKTALGLDINVGSMVCYLNICVPIGLIYSIIVVISDKTNKLPRFHAFQSLLLLGALVVVGFVIGFVAGMMAVAMNAPIFSMGFNGLFGLICLGLAIFMAMKAYNGEMYKLPVIGDLADQWSN